MKDESSRRAYDLTYPYLIRRSPFPPTTKAPCPPSASTSQPGAPNEAAQIAALQKSKEERGARWRFKKNAFDTSMFQLQRGIWQLEREIKGLKIIIDAEAATEAQKNSWTAWLMSPISKKAEDTEEEKARKDRWRQESRIEKDMKERRLALTKADLKREQGLLGKAKEEIDAADLADERKIQMLQAKIRAREAWEREEREKEERERMVKIWKQQKEQREQREKAEREREKAEQERMAKIRKQQQAQREQREKEAAEALRKKLAEQRAAEQKRHEEATRKWQEFINNETGKYERSTHRQAYSSTCRHDGWWSKVQGRTACPKCYEIWTYLLQCPGCKMKACPKCQATIRPRLSRHRARTDRSTPSYARPPTPNPYYYDDF